LFRDLLDELYVSQKLGKLLICRDYSASKCRGHIYLCAEYIYIYAICRGNRWFYVAPHVAQFLCLCAKFM